MEIKTAIEILEYHQEWRLGRREDMIHEPKKLTQALDIVLSEVKKLLICGVSITLPPEENILNAMKLLAEIDYKNEWVWGHDTDLGKPKDVIEAFKNELLGN